MIADEAASLSCQRYRGLLNIPHDLAQMYGTTQISQCVYLIMIKALRLHQAAIGRPIVRCSYVGASA